MNTTAAAIQANVTVATIRTWCRRGIIAATKQAGRWIIDTASLAHRITIGTWKKPVAKPITFTTQNMVAIGGNRWQRGDKDRVYLNNWWDFAGLEIDTYKSGNISSATWQGEYISNNDAGKILGSISKVYFDAADGNLHCQYGYGNLRSIPCEQVWDAIVTGVRTAIAAL